MLELPRDWRLYTGGYIAQYLLEQVADGVGRVRFSRHLIRASLDLAVATFFARRDPTVTVTEGPSRRWRVDRMRYLFMPVVDNDTLSTLQHALPTPEFTFVIVPTNHEILLRSALGGYSNPKAPNIQSFDDFMSWRVNFGGMDSGWPRDRVLGFLISRYNFHAASAGLGQSMLVRKPYRRRQNSRPDRAR